MAFDDPIRASDTDREVVVATLREAYTAGRLTMDEFNERMAAAYASRTWGDLRELTVDLPVQPVLGGDVPGRAPEADGAVSGAVSPAPAPDQELKPGEEQPLQPDMRRRRSPVGILVPFVIVMLLATHGIVGPGVIFLVIIVAALASILGSIRR
jgi:hypothetical protein